MDSVIAVLQTNYQEATEFLTSYSSWSSYCIFLFLYVGIVVVLYRALQCIFTTATTILSTWQYLKKAGILATVLVGCCVFLPKLYVVTTIRGAVKYMAELTKFETYKNNRVYILNKCNWGGKSVQVSKGNFALVIGESETSTHMSAYGYSRETTPWVSSMSKEGSIVLLPDVFACGAQTQQVLEMALTEKSQYNRIHLKDSMTIVEMARHAGYRTVWLSAQNNDANSQIAGQIGNEADTTEWLNQNKNVAYMGQRTGDFDNSIVKRLGTMEKSAQPTLYIIHLLGSHRRYDCRYPEEFNIWDEKNNFLNAYDNSILYNDYILQKIHELLFAKFDVSAMLYFADHGDETEQYFNHGTDFFLANYKKLPSVMDVIKTPFFVCFSTSYKQNNPQKLANVLKNSQKYFSNDMIYDTLLGLMDINCCHYAPEQDISSDTYAFDKDNLCTMHGMLKVKDIL